MPFIARSKEEMSEGAGYPALPADSYVMSVDNIEVSSQPDIYKRTPEYPEGTPRDVAVVRFKPLSFANGDELVDWEDNPVHPDKRVMGFFDLTKLGFSKAHGPSKTRRFLAAITGRDIDDEIEVGEWPEYIGTKVQVTLRLDTKDGFKRNNIDDIKVYRKRRKASAADTPASTTNEVSSPEDLLSKAAEVFGEGGF